MQMVNRTRHHGFWANKFTIEDGIIYAILLAIFLLTFYPFFYTLSLAVMPYENYVRQTVHLFPTGFSLQAYEEILLTPNLARAFANSIIKTVLGTTASVVLTTMAGYALSRKGLKLGRPLIAFFIVPMWFGGGIIAYYLVLRAVGLLNTFWAMIIPGLVGPFTIFLVRAYYREYPQEIIEAAIVDGADNFAVFWKIVWPTSKPIIATMALLIGTGHWNDYFWPSLVVPPEWQPATVILQRLTFNRNLYESLGLGVRTVHQSFIAAVASLLIIPVLIAYPFLQRYVIKGIMIGSIKG
jgi:putative aldouronate transport system permease protein